MPKIAYVGDEYHCSCHGKDVIAEGGSSMVYGCAVARLGDRCACGCLIIEGWPDTVCDGRPVDFSGTKTTGGVIGVCSGSETVM